MIRFRLADTVQALDRAVRTAGLNQSDVSRVLLVGGSSRIPLVRTLLSESFGRPVSVDADPESSIALGAAAAAAQWAASPGGAAAPGPAVFAAPVIPVIAADAVLERPSGPTVRPPDVEPERGDRRSGSGRLGRGRDVERARGRDDRANGRAGAGADRAASGGRVDRRGW